MIKPIPRFVVLLGAAIVAISPAFAAEPGKPPAQTPVPPAPQAVPRQIQPAAPKGADGLANQPLPNTAAERNKLLSNLYAYLATAEDAKQAQPISQAIERLWLFTGSDTIGLLMDRSARAVGDKNLPLALKFLDAIVDLAPDYAEGWNRRAYVHYLNNDVERMVGDLRRCIALEPSHYRAMEMLGQVLRETGQKKAALRAFERLMEINPNTPGVADAIKELARDVDGQRT